MLHRPYPRNLAAFAARLLLSVTLLVSPVLAATTEQAPPATTVKPWFVVFVRPNQQDNPKPVYDGKDLELYFANQLNAQRIDAVVPFSTARIPKPATPDVYLLELTVDALSTGHRTRHDWGGNYVDDPFVHTELSLKIWNLASQRLIGEVGERRDYHIEDPENTERQRARLYETADHLADGFVAQVTAGHFGKDLQSIQRPLTWDDFTIYEQVGCVILVSVILVLIAFVLIKLSLSVAALLRRLFRGVTPRKSPSINTRQPLQPPAPVVMLPSPAPTRNLPEPAVSTEPPREWEERIKKAIALSLSTDDFSDAACVAIAREQGGEIRKHGRRYEEAEAARLLRAKDAMEENRRAAAEWAKHSDLSESEILNVLENADMWDYRLLLAAKNLAQDGQN